LTGTAKLGDFACLHPDLPSGRDGQTGDVTSGPRPAVSVDAIPLAAEKCPWPCPACRQSRHCASSASPATPMELANGAVESRAVKPHDSRWKRELLRKATFRGTSTPATSTVPHLRGPPNPCPVQQPMPSVTLPRAFIHLRHVNYSSTSEGILDSAQVLLWASRSTLGTDISLRYMTERKYS
jgi:hypothetical protein